MTGALLRDVVADQAEAAEDLLQVVAQAPRLKDLEAFQCVQMRVVAGNLTLSIEEVDMYSMPLSTDGTPLMLTSRASLSQHAASEALLVLDLRVRGRSVLKLAS